MRRPAMRTEGASPLARWLQVARRMAGMPDYAAYLEHRERHHPGEPPLSERDFYTDFVTARYADSPTRCC